FTSSLFSSRRRHTRSKRDWSSDVCSSDLKDRNVVYNLEELEKKIGYIFQDQKLLKQALTHSSFANEQRINRLGSYERLEFLGDRSEERRVGEELRCRGQR